MQRRLRDLPSRVGVHFLLATCLFPEVGYRLVRDKLTAGPSGTVIVCPSTKAPRELRRRLGSAPVRALSEVPAGPLARPTTASLSVTPAMLLSMDEEPVGRVYGTDHDDPYQGPRPGHDYRELVAGPLDGLLLDVTGWSPEELVDGAALRTEIGKYGANGRSHYGPRQADLLRWDWQGDSH